MKCEEMIREVYFVAGKLEGLSLYLQRNSSDAVVTSLSDCVDRLELVGAHLLRCCDPTIEIKGMPSDEEMDMLLKPCKAVIECERHFQEAFGRVYPAQEDTRADQYTAGPIGLRMHG